MLLGSEATLGALALVEQPSGFCVAYWRRTGMLWVVDPVRRNITRESENWLLRSVGPLGPIYGRDHERGSKYLGMVFTMTLIGEHPRVEPYWACRPLDSEQRLKSVEWTVHARKP